jgi:hypothetical protein
VCEREREREREIAEQKTVLLKKSDMTLLVENVIE